MRFTLISLCAAGGMLLLACGGSIAELPDGTPKPHSSLDAGAAGPEVLFTEDPATWWLTGKDPDLYSLTSVDTQVVVDGKATTRIEQVAKHGHNDIPWAFARPDSRSATPYRGKRMRMTAQMKTEAATSGGGWLWLRFNDGATGMCNMDERLVKGTNDFAPVSCVLDVPTDTEWFAFGFGLSGSGKVWLSTVTFEAVGTDVPIAR